LLSAHQRRKAFFERIVLIRQPSARWMVTIPKGEGGKSLDRFLQEPPPQLFAFAQTFDPTFAQTTPKKGFSKWDREDFSQQIH
jgi:hypothetical protein